MKKIYCIILLLLITGRLFAISLQECLDIANIRIKASWIKGKHVYNTDQFWYYQGKPVLDSRMLGFELQQQFQNYDTSIFYRFKYHQYWLHISHPVNEPAADNIKYLNVVTDDSNSIVALIGYLQDPTGESLAENIEWTKSDLGRPANFVRTNILYWKQNNRVKFMGTW
ncbi:MAG TPA: hypothetical protein VMF29_02305, partial [Candidatus Edwardsbacteria bacterium]|nr:hypothetical protein [Candidatus Edwardsbacteria bacterium]